MAARIHILLPVHNRLEVTRRFVEALAAQTWTDYKLVLIDDGSSDGTAGAVKLLLPETVVITGKGDWWWAGALEQGCRYLKAQDARGEDVVLFINDDLHIGTDFLAKAMAEFETTDANLLLARQIDASTGREIGDGGGVHANVVRMRFSETKRPEDINCLPTRGLFMRWRDVQAVGGFKPRELPHYLSDYEFTHRAWRKGMKLAVMREAFVGVQLERSGDSLWTLFRLPRSRRLAMVFSIRFKDNPVTWSRFVTNAVFPCILRVVPLTKIWIHFVWVAVRCAWVSPR